MAKVRKGKSVKKGLKFFIYGQQGTWKSSMALELLKMTNEEGRPLRVAYIDTEFGSVDSYLEDLESESIDTDNLLLIYTNEEAEIIEWLDNLMENEDLYIEDEDGEEELVLDADGNKFIADAIVIDSMTVILDTTKYGMIQVSEKRASVKASKKADVTATEKFVAQATAGMELKDYDKLNHRGKNINRKLIANTDKYIVAIAREKVEYKKQKVNGQFENVPVGYKPDCYKGSQYEYYTVLRMFEDEDDGLIKAQVERKDRTKRFAQGEIIVEPSLTLWQEIIDKNKGKKAMPVSDKSYNESVDAETTHLIKEENKTAEFSDEEADKTINLGTPEELANAIIDYRKAMSPTKRKSVTSVFKKAGLPTGKPTEIKDMEILEKMYETIKSI